MRKVIIQRLIETNLSVISSFTIQDENGKDLLRLYGLEPSRLTPVHPGHPCIQAGEYDVKLSQSPHLGYLCPEVLNVPGRTAIRWHIGNFPKDVLGCVIVGIGYTTDMVISSREAFKKMMETLGGHQIRAVYLDPPQVKAMKAAA